MFRAANYSNYVDDVGFHKFIGHREWRSLIQTSGYFRPPLTIQKTVILIHLNRTAKRVRYPQTWCCKSMSRIILKHGCIMFWFIQVEGFNEAVNRRVGFLLCPDFGWTFFYVILSIISCLPRFIGFNWKSHSSLQTNPLLMEPLGKIQFTENVHALTDVSVKCAGRIILRSRSESDKCTGKKTNACAMHPTKWGIPVFRIVICSVCGPST